MVVNAQRKDGETYNPVLLCGNNQSNMKSQLDAFSSLFSFLF